MVCLSHRRGSGNSGRNLPHSSAQLRRAFSAWICLLAGALLFAPYAGAAWVSHAMSCCTGDHCAIPQHHHRREAPVHADCDHDGGAGASMTECAMSCCQDNERPLMAAMTFVMPPAEVVAAPMPATPAVDAPRSREIPRSVTPLLQPPRVLSFAV
jgi:hypothetical protein